MTGADAVPDPRCDYPTCRLPGVDYAQLARKVEASRTYLLERFGVTTDEMRAGL